MVPMIIGFVKYSPLLTLIIWLPKCYIYLDKSCIHSDTFHEDILLMTL